EEGGDGSLLRRWWQRKQGLSKVGVLDALDGRTLLRPFEQKEIVQPLNPPEEELGTAGASAEVERLHVLIECDLSSIDGNWNGVFQDAGTDHHQDASRRNQSGGAARKSFLG